MFKKALNIFLVILGSVQLQAQTYTVNIQPDAQLGKDTRIQLFDDNGKNGDLSLPLSNGIAPTRWTAGGWFVERAYLQFDFSMIPDNAIILSANISLKGVGHNPLQRPNLCYMSRVLQAWDENTLTWNNQPNLIETSDRISFGPTASATQDVIIDVKNHVQKMVNFKSSNFGWMIMLQDEVTKSYTKLYAASSDDPIPANRPKIAIVYTLPMNISAGIVHASGLNAADAKITLNVSEGVAPYTYLWDDGSSGNVLNNKLPGLYTCVVTDAAGNKQKKYFAVGAIGSPVTINLQPDGLAGKDAYIMLRGSIYTDNVNFGDNDYLEASHVNLRGWITKRSFISFDLSSIPQDAIVNAATLNLYGTNHSNFNNAAVLSRVSAPWYENLITWNNQPPLETSDNISLNAIASSDGNYAIDVIDHAKKMVGNPKYNNGWNLSLSSANERGVEYSLLNFISSDNATAALRPALNITFTIQASCDDNRNWVYSKTFGELGEVTGESKIFTDYLGRNTQSQTRSFSDNTVLATQTLFDGFGRAVGQTLPAPTKQNTLCYKTNFVVNTAGNNYNYNDFDSPITGNNLAGEVNNPKPFGNASPGTVGYYYSNNNNLEPYVAADDYPYSRIEFMNDPSGTVKRSSGVGASHKMGSTHEGSVYNLINAGELDYMFGFHGTYERDDNFQWRKDKNENLNLLKTISIDADGKEVISYTNSAGQTIATCLSGDPNSTCTAQKVAQSIRFTGNGFTTVHLPKSKNNTLSFPLKYSNATSNNANSDIIVNNLLANNNTFKLYPVLQDLKSGKLLQAGSTAGSGDYYLDETSRKITFYGDYSNTSLYLRVAYAIKTSYAKDMYSVFDHNGYLLDKNYFPELVLEYELDYSNWSLNYTDTKGQTVATVSPNDVNCSNYLTGTNYTTINANTNSNPQGLSLNGVNLSGQWNDAVLDIVPALYDPYNTLNQKTGSVQQSAQYTPSNYGSVFNAVNSLVSNASLQNVGTASAPNFVNAVTVSDAPVEVIQINNTANKNGGNGGSLYPNGSIVFTYTYATTIQYTQSNGTVVTDPTPLNFNVDFVYVNGNVPAKLAKGDLKVYIYGASLNIPSLNLSNLLKIGVSYQVVSGRVLGITGISDQRIFSNAELNNSSGIQPLFMANSNYSATDNYNQWNWFAGIWAYTMLKYDLTIASHTAIPNHKISTKNYYDNRGRIVAGESTDEGRTDMVYDNENKLRFTQNAKQKALTIGAGTSQSTGAPFTYINYDRAGRPVETGEFVPGPKAPLYFQSHAQYNAGVPATQGYTSVFTIVNDLDGLPDGNCQSQQYTTYDVADAAIPPVSGAATAYLQTNVNGNISKTANANSTTWYSYDNMGRLSWTLQNINGLGLKTHNYTYNLLGQVLQTVYQAESTSERFFHHYEYDANGRLKKAYTSFDGLNKTQQANYSFYTHGPLKREEIGGNLQGIDYVYTINGMLKSMNEPGLNPANDPGKDNLQGSPNAAFGKDVFGYTIDYYNSDYQRNGTSIASFNSSVYPANNNSSYSGLIKSVRWQTQLPSAAPNNFPGMLMYEYRYDFKSQLTEASFNYGFNPNPGNQSVILTPKSDYKVSGITYDNNGNIKTLKRNSYAVAGATSPLDDLSYNYDAAKPNRLQYIKDAVPASANTKQQLDLINQTDVKNYQYNDIGELVANTQENTKIEYNVYGKVVNVLDKSTNALKLKFDYNDKGLRQSKTVYNTAGVATDKYWYVYDGGGLLQSTYRTVITANTTAQEELMVYASSRLGVYNRSSSKFMYEINDHLGNVRAVVSEIKVPQQPLSSFNDTNTDGWVPANAASTLSIENAQLKVSVNAAWGTAHKTFTVIPGRTYTIVGNITNDAAQWPHIVVWDGTKGTRLATQIHYYTNDQPFTFTALSNSVNVDFTLGEPGVFYMANVGIKELSSNGTVYSQNFDSGTIDAWTADGAASVANVNGALQANFKSKDADGAYKTFNTIAGNTYLVNFNADFNGFLCNVIDATNNSTFTHYYFETNEAAKVFTFTAKSAQTKLRFYVPGWSTYNGPMVINIDDVKLINAIYNSTISIPEVVSYTDYFPHGGVLPGRQYVSASGYKFGYQGQEYDNESGLSNFELRQYDARIGRWFAPDPYGQYPSPYLAMGNNPVSSIDPDGGQAKGSGGGYFGDIPMDNYWSGEEYYGSDIHPGGFVGMSPSDRANYQNAMGTSYQAQEIEKQLTIMQFGGYEHSTKHGGWGIWHKEIISSTTEGSDGTKLILIEDGGSLTFEKKISDAAIAKYFNFIKHKAKAIKNYIGGGIGLYPDENSQNGSLPSGWSVLGTGVNYQNSVSNTNAQSNGGVMQADLSPNEHLIGPGLILWGQPDVPKPGGAGGGGKSGKWTSGASKTLRSADRAIQTKLGTKVTLPFKILGTKGIGAALGRLVPLAGWGLTAYDIYDNREAIKEYAPYLGQGMQERQKLVQQHPFDIPVCFVKGTLVYTTLGLISIEKIAVGDSVYSYNLEKGRVEKSKVAKVFERITKEIYLLNTNQEQIEVTAEHPFYVQDKGWIKVKDLKANYVLKTEDNKTELIKTTILIKEEKVYNIEVEGNHNYFISKSKILVHNK